MAREAVIETERLRLRPIEFGGLDDPVALHADPEVTRFIRPLDRDAAEERIRRDGSEWLERGHGLLAMINSDNVRSVRVAGRLGLTPMRDDVLLGDPVVVYGLDRPASR